MLESAIERKVVAYAKARGWLVWKFDVIIGLPDRILLGNGRVWFIEFKAPGKKPRPIQVKMHEILRKAGFLVFVVDGVEAGKILVAERTDVWLSGADL